MSIPIIDEVVEQLKVMPQPLQRQVLEFIRSLIKAEVRGTPGQQLLCFAGSLSSDDLQYLRMMSGLQPQTLIVARVKGLSIEEVQQLQQRINEFPQG